MNLGDALKALALREYYNGLRIGYDGASDCRFLVGPRPFTLSTDQLAVFMEQGEVFRTWFEITLNLCTQAYRDWALRWLADLVEGEMPPEVKGVHRKAHLSGGLRIPLFARPDMPDVGISVEVQTPGSGWGYQTAIHNSVERSQWPGLVEELKRAVAAVTGSSSSIASYVLYNEPFFREVEYFCKLCQNAGMQMQMHFKSLPPPSEVEFVRRPPLENLMSYEGGPELLQSWFDRKLVLEPSPSLLFDQKLAILFPFHPQLQELYPDAVRELFPETYLVERDRSFYFDGQSMSLDDLCDLSRSKRQFILKYAGSKKGMRAGGKEVYRLDRCNKEQLVQLLGRAVRDWEERRAPWLLQKRIQAKYQVTFLDHEVGELREAPHYTLFRPMYSFLPGEQARVASLTGNFRTDWKVHGSSDCVMLPVEP